jgi:coenzyme F420 hydrogenase subunit beta
MAMRREHSDLNRNLGLVLTFFCAGTPSSQGTKDLVTALGLDPEEIGKIAYRGEGWPGEFRAVTRDGQAQTSLSYSQSWGFLTNYRPLRCNICPDGLGRLADLACGDSWANFTEGGADAGRSLVLVRTERGRRILHEAMSEGYITVSPVGPELVLRAQENLLQRRRELFGRLIGMKSLFMPIPLFKGFSLYQSWLQLRLGTKFLTVLGTMRRMIKRDYWRPSRPVAMPPACASPAGECPPVASRIK